MPWGEAIRLTRILALDPASAIGAAVANFDRPTSRESLVLMDLYDLTHSRGTKRRPPPYPRPWNAPKRHGRARLTIDELRSILDRHRADDEDEGTVIEGG